MNVLEIGMFDLGWFSSVNEHTIYFLSTPLVTDHWTTMCGVEGLEPSTSALVRPSSIITLFLLASVVVKHYWIIHVSLDSCFFTWLNEVVHKFLWLIRFSFLFFGWLSSINWLYFGFWNKIVFLSLSFFHFPPFNALAKL